MKTRGRKRGRKRGGREGRKSGGREGGREERREGDLKVHLRDGGRESLKHFSLFLLAGLRRSGRVKGLKADVRK